MTTSPFTCVLDIRASLGECALWSTTDRALWWVDINAPALNRFDPATGKNVAFPMPSAIGCFGFRAKGGFVVALRDGIWLADAQARLERKLVDAPYDPSHHRFNDGRVDRDGRFWAGSMNENRDRPSAALYRLDPGGRLDAVIESITVSNGLGWSPDGRTMYHADTPTHSVRAYDFDRTTGAIARPRTFVQFHGETDRPDGCTVDAEGCYWTAFYRGGKVLRIDPSGHVLREIPVPAMCATMCALGGDDLRTLFVTTARQQRDAEELARLPQSGSLFALRVDVPGLPEPSYAG